MCRQICLRNEVNNYQKKVSWDFQCETHTCCLSIKGLFEKGDPERRIQSDLMQQD